MKPYCLTTSRTGCDILCFGCTLCHAWLIPTKPRDHTESQIESVSWSAIPISGATYPIWINITVSPYLTILFRYLNACFVAMRSTCLESIKSWLKMFKEKHMYSLVFIRYIKEPIIFWYIVESTDFIEESHSSFNFDSNGVAIVLHSRILNLFKISTTYFPWLRNIPSALYHFSMPKKYSIIPIYFISNSMKKIHFASGMSSSSPLRNMSSTYSRSVIGILH